MAKKKGNKIRLMIEVTPDTHLEVSKNGLNTLVQDFFKKALISLRIDVSEIVIKAENEPSE